MHLILIEFNAFIIPSSCNYFSTALNINISVCCQAREIRKTCDRWQKERRNDKRLRGVGHGKRATPLKKAPGQTISNTRQRTLQRDITWDEIIQPASAS